VSLLRTPSQTVGPYYAIGLSRRVENELADPHDAASLRLHGQLLDGEGRPVPDGMVELWDHVGHTWGRSGTDADGRFQFVVAKPSGAGGEAPRLDVLVFARGLLRHQLTRVYFPDETQQNAADPVYAALSGEQQQTLVAEPEDGALRFDIHLQGNRQTTFFVH
jgi:protocatechuate 3,4-dioxygenase, alpha subunit